MTLLQGVYEMLIASLEKKHVKISNYNGSLSYLARKDENFYDWKEITSFYRIV